MATDRTAFPWVPKTTWRQITPSNRQTSLWECRIEDPTPNPPYLKAVCVRSTDFRECVNIARDNVWWWLDWDGRRTRFIRECWTEPVQKES